MAKYKAKTLENEASVDKFLDKVEPEEKRDDCRAIVKMMSDVTKEPAKMWGTGIVGFGSVHYKYESGHEGDMPRIGFAPRKANIVLYMDKAAINDKDVKKMGKVKTSTGCMYINKLSEIDTKILKDLMKKSIKS